MKREITTILDFLFLGRYQDSLDYNLLLKLGVTHVLNVMESSKSDEGSSFQRLHVPISDLGESDLGPLLVRCCEFIEQARANAGKVFLHCGRGQNRSPTVATAYLMRHRRMNLKEAFYFVRGRRPQFAPHERYLAYLQALDAELFGTLSLTEDKEPLSIQAIARKISETTDI